MINKAYLRVYSGEDKASYNPDGASGVFQMRKRFIENRLKALQGVKSITQKDSKALQEIGTEISKIYKSSAMQNIVKSLEEKNKESQEELKEKADQEILNLLGKMLNRRGAKLERDDNNNFSFSNNAEIIKEMETLYSKIQNISLRFKSICGEGKMNKIGTIRNFVTELTEAMNNFEGVIRTKVAAKNDGFFQAAMREFEKSAFGEKGFVKAVSKEALTGNGRSVQQQFYRALEKLKEALKYDEFFDIQKNKSNGNLAEIRGKVGEFSAAMLEKKLEEKEQYYEKTTAETFHKHFKELSKDGPIVGGTGSSYNIQVSFDEDSKISDYLEKFPQKKDSDKEESDGIVTVKSFTSSAETQDKIDVKVDLSRFFEEAKKDSKLGGAIKKAGHISVKNYTPQGKFLKPHLQDVSLWKSLLYNGDGNADGAFQYHWLNLKATGINPNLLKEGNNTLEAQIAYEALMHGNIFKKDAEDAGLFIAIDSTSGKVFVKDTYSIIMNKISKLAKEEGSSNAEMIFKPNLSNISLGIDEGEITNVLKDIPVKEEYYPGSEYYCIRRAEVRAAQVLANIHSQKIEVSLKIDLTKENGDVYSV